MKSKGKSMLAVAMAICITAGAVVFAPIDAVAIGLDTDNNTVMHNLNLLAIDNDVKNNEMYSSPPYNSFTFKSVEELYEGLFIGFTVEQINNNRLRDLIEGRQNERSVYIPIYQGDRIPFRNKEGLPNVYIAPNDWMERPWIFFNCRLETDELLVQTMYLDDEIIQTANDKGCSWLINQLSPNTPNVGNIDMFPHYKKIYEQNLELKDRSVNALIYELVEESKKDVSFVYDGILVCVSGEANEIDNEFFSQLRFEQFSMKLDVFKMTLSTEIGGTAATGKSGYYKQGDVIEITAQPNSGYKFGGWTATAGTFDNANNTNTTFTMPAGDVAIIADFDFDLPILNVNGRMLYPFRECLEAMGANVLWIAETKTAKGTLGGQTVEFIVGSGTYKVNGKQMQMDAGVTSFIKDGRTYIPIRYAAEALGFTVEWDEATQTVNIK